MALTLRATSPTPRFGDRELVAAARRGNDEAVEELFARYRSRIGSYVFGMIGDHGRAEDVTQEVFISAFRRLRHSERPIAFKPWVYEIAKNACIDEFRRTRRHHEVPLAHEDADSVSSQIAQWQAGPVEAVESKQRLDDLRGAFGGLSEPHHRILVLRELEGLSYEEISARMGMSRAVVESTLFRARRRLHREYEELASGRRCEQVCAMIDDGRASSSRRLGIRARRQFARHVAHCQSCRNHARLGDVDEKLLDAPSLVKKLAALLPWPWLRWRRGKPGENAASGVSGHSLIISQAIQRFALVADPLVPSLGFGRAAAAAAALAIAGVGGGVVDALQSGSPNAPAQTGQARSGSIAAVAAATAASDPASAHAPRQADPAVAGGLRSAGTAGRDSAPTGAAISKDIGADGSRAAAPRSFTLPRLPMRGVTGLHGLLGAQSVRPGHSGLGGWMKKGGGTSGIPSGVVDQTGPRLPPGSPPQLLRAAKDGVSRAARGITAPGQERPSGPG